MKFEAKISDAKIPFEKFLEKIRRDAELKKNYTFEGKISDKEYFQNLIFKSKIRVTFITSNIGGIQYTLEGEVDDDALLNGIDAKKD